MLEHETPCPTHYIAHGYLPGFTVVVGAAVVILCALVVVSGSEVVVILLWSVEVESEWVVVSGGDEVVELLPEDKSPGISSSTRADATAVNKTVNVKLIRQRLRTFCQYTASLSSKYTE